MSSNLELYYKQKFEDAYWDMVLLAYEKKKSLDWVYISNNSNISFEKFLNCTNEEINKKLNWGNIHSNSSLTLDVIDKHSYIKWNYYEGLSYNENITQEFIIDNIEQNWNIFALSMHKNITWEFMQKYKKDKWNQYCISSHSNITWDIIKNNPDFKWNSYGVSLNPNITWDIIKNNLDFDWKWDILSEHPNIDYSILINNSEYLWNWKNFSSNPNLTWNIIKNNMSKAWSWNKISENKCITYDIVKNNLEYPWNEIGLSYNENITWEQYLILEELLLKKYKLTDVNRYYYSGNSNLTPFIVLSKFDIKWDWRLISYNKMEKGKLEYIKKEIKLISYYILKKKILNIDLIEHILLFI